MSFCVMYDYMTITVTYDECVTVCSSYSDIMLIPNTKSKNKKINEIENRNKK